MISLSVLLFLFKTSNVVVESSLGFFKFGDLLFLFFDPILGLLDFLLLLLQIHDFAPHLFGLPLLKNLQIAVYDLLYPLQPTQRQPVPPKINHYQSMVLAQHLGVDLLVFL